MYTRERSGRWLQPCAAAACGAFNSVLFDSIAGMCVCLCVYIGARRDWKIICGKWMLDVYYDLSDEKFTCIVCILYINNYIGREIDFKV